MSLRVCLCEPATKKTSAIQLSHLKNFIFLPPAFGLYLTRLRQRFIHNEYLELPDLNSVLADGIEAAKKEIACYGEWMKTSVDSSKLTRWVDGILKDRWGALAAARTNHICRTGHDGVFADPFESAPPSQKRMARMQKVPGCPSTSDNAFAIAQVLAWIAKERRDISEQLDRMREIPELMASMLRRD